LFAALNILESLYEACLERMRFFLEEWGETGRKNHPNYQKLFTDTLKRVEDHPNHRYFIFKSIIVNNLYGVDIMEEAVEICKLRLFLKLVAQIERVEDIEPLPDIDFNIRAGNSLIGFVSLEEVKKTQEGTLGFGKSEVSRIEEEAEIADRAFRKFREMQTAQGMSPSDFSEAKENLRARLKKLTDELDRFLAGEYGINKSNILGKKKFSDAFEKWRKSHQPFHWFADFYGILKVGGFDVIIGNPPYVSARKVSDYTIRGYKIQECPDIYAWCIERVIALTHRASMTGMIVPLSICFSGDFDPLRRLLLSKYSENWFSSFGRIPSALFAHDVRVRNTIHLGARHSINPGHNSSRLNRWFDAERPHLFHLLSYSRFNPILWKWRIPKLNTQRVVDAFEFLLGSNGHRIDSILLSHQTSHNLFFKKTAYNWLTFCISLPPCYDENGSPIPHTKFGEVYFANPQYRDIAFLLLNGKLEFAFWCAVGDDFDVTRWMFADFPGDISRLPSTTFQELLPIAEKLRTATGKAVSFKLNAGKKVGTYNLALCRNVTDLSDAIFAKILGFSDAWDDVELLYTEIVRTNFDDEGDDL
ncbi:MAG: hypothetical protein V1909_02580, partial [Candidatus Micrarchaeota archaeon]